MQIIKLREDFLAGKILKQDYIDQMFKFHEILQEYPELIKETNISKIEIEDGSLIATTKDKGIRLHANAQDKRLIPFETMNFYGYEEKEIEVIEQLIEKSSSKNIFDIGANIGYISLFIGKTFSETQLFSFEPIPDTFNQLCANIELNQLKNIKPFNHGLSNMAGPVEFFFYPEGSGNASLQELTVTDSLKKVKTSVQKLDDVVENIGVAPDFIKCDVEGAELLVFLGAQELLKTVKPIVYSEMLRKWASRFNYHPNDIISLFADHGYDCYVIKEGQLTQFHSVTETTVETNYIFLHREKHAEVIIRMTKTQF